MLMAFLFFAEYILCFLTVGMESNSQSVQQHTEGKKKNERLSQWVFSCSQVMVHKQQMAVASQQGNPTLLAQVSASSSSSPPASSQDTPFLHSQAKVEDVSPVDAKLRAKALRPPLTIKSFFKPKAASSGDACASEDFAQPEMSSQQHASSSERSHGTSKRESREASKRESADAKSATSGSGEDEEDCVVLDESCQSKPDVKEEQRDVSGSSVSDSSRRETKRRKESKNRSRVNSSGKTADLVKVDKMDTDANSNSLMTTKQRKRKSAQTSVEPKAKQARSQTVKSDNKTQEGKQKKCPICDMLFEAGTWNDEINAHIDNCLIK